MAIVSPPALFIYAPSPFHTPQLNLGPIGARTFDTLV